jgi:hypothetical protein
MIQRVTEEAHAMTTLPYANVVHMLGSNVTALFLVFSHSVGQETKRLFGSGTALLLLFALFCYTRNKNVAWL